MSSVCRQYNPNPWKPTVCRDCRQPQSAHFETGSLAAVPEADVVQNTRGSTVDANYANMPIKGSKAKKSPSFSKKFNSLIGRDKEKPPRAAPRKKPLTVDISGPIRPGDRLQSDSSFESVSSLGEEIGTLDVGSFGDAFDEILQTNGETTEVDGPENPVSTSSPIPIEGEKSSQGVKNDINGYTEIDIMSPTDQAPIRTTPSEEKERNGSASSCSSQSSTKPPLKPKPALKNKPKINISTKRRVPPPVPAPYGSKSKGNSLDRNGAKNGVSSEVNSIIREETSSPNSTTVITPTETTTPELVPADTTTPTEKTAPVPTKRSTPTPPLAERPPVNKRSTPTPPLAERPPVNKRSTPTPPLTSRPAPPKRTTPTPPLTDRPAPIPAKRSSSSSSPTETTPPVPVARTTPTSEEPSSESVEHKDANKPHPLPKIKSALLSDDTVVMKSRSSPRQRSATLGSQPRRRAPPAPPVKKTEDPHSPLTSSVEITSEGVDVPPPKPQRALKSSTSADTLRARTDTSPSSQKPSVSIGDLHRHAANKEDGENVESTDGNTKEKKKKTSAFSKMKHKFGKSKTPKDSPPKEPAQAHVDVEASVDGDKDEKKGFKLFRKRSKTFSGRKGGNVDGNDSGSQENSPIPIQRGRSHSPPPPPTTSSPTPPRRRAATSTMANRPLPSIQQGDRGDHDYAECGDKLVSKPVQEHSGNSTSGSVHVPSRPSTSQSSGIDRISITSDLLPSLHPETVPNDPLILSVGQLQALMAETINDSCKRISGMYKQLFTPPSSLKVTWKDCRQVEDWPAVEIDGKAYGVQVIDSKRSELEEEVATAAPPHPHVVRRLAILSDVPSFDITGLPKTRGLHKFLVSSASSNVTVREFLRMYRGKVSQERYERMVCFILLQMFLALHHLHRQGIVHCDLSPDSLLINPDNHHVQISDFSFALCKKSKGFVHSRQDVNILTDTSCRFPPEIMGAMHKQTELDFSGTSVFQSGCLIYELMGQDHPFESEPELIHTYTLADLPPFAPSSPYSSHLQVLTRLLLNPEQKSRISAAATLQILSCLLWLPHSWTLQPVAETHVHNYLIYEKTRLVAEFGENFAKSEPKDHVQLEGLLKSSFFTLVSANQILKTLETYSRDMVTLLS